MSKNIQKHTKTHKKIQIKYKKINKNTQKVTFSYKK